MPTRSLYFVKFELGDSKLIIWLSFNDDTPHLVISSYRASKVSVEKKVDENLFKAPCLTCVSPCRNVVTLLVKEGCREGCYCY